MIEFISSLFSKLSSVHLNVLFLLGLAMFGGTIGGRLFQKLRIPQVVGYIVVGILIGQTGVGIISEQTIQAFQPFNYFALGLIGFMIGGELKKEIFLKYGKQFVYILLCEGIASFLLVSILVGLVGSFFFYNASLSWSLAFLLGAIASATAPAATTHVLWEYKTKGPLTTTVLGIVAMDDGLALILFAIASSVAGALIGNSDAGIINLFLFPIYEIGGSILIGFLSGLNLSKILKRYSEEKRVLTFSVGTVLIVLGLALIMDLDILLAAMSLGVTVVNFAPRKSKEMFKLIGAFTPPIYVLFFVLVGAKLNLSYLSLPVIVLSIIYLIGRTVGKMAGANLGARISNAAGTVQKYLPLCLFSQAGVAIGLSILASHRFPGEIGHTIVIIVITTVFILEIVGPAFVKIAVTKAGEVGLNITEEDIIKGSKVEEIMDKKTPVIYMDMPLNKILELFYKHSYLFYPVVTGDKNLIGILSIYNIKDTFLVSGLDDFLLAFDLMEPVIAVTRPEMSMSEVKEIMNENNIEFLPVVSDDNKVLGCFESRGINRLIAKKIAELKNQLKSLE